MYYDAPVELHNDQLRWLLEKGKNTEYGKKYGFADIKGPEEFRKRLPVVAYDALRPYIERGVNGENNVLWPEPVTWYAKSSGTTEKRSKFIPVSPASLKYSHLMGGRDSVYSAMNIFPGLKAFSGKTLALGGSHSPGKGKFGIRNGDLSAIMIENAPKWTSYVKVPDPEIMLMEDWDRKIEMICRSTMDRDVRCLAGVPSWFLSLIQKILRDTGKDNLLEIWPHLELFIHGGVGFEPYREIYRKLIPSESMHYLETYNASEGFFGIQSSADDTSLQLMLDYRTYYEFIPIENLGRENPETLTLDEVETGRNYALVITTPAGLWRYNIGDTIQFTSLAPYKFRITGRTKLFINIFGEELMIDNANRAVSISSQICDCKVYDFTVAPCYMSEAGKGAHEWIVEFISAPEDVPEFASVLDKELRKVNSDYDAKRNSSLEELKLHVAPEGFFNSWLKDEGKLGGQNKVPRLRNDRELMEKLLERLYPGR